ncbi:hypothetical protein JMJ56_28565 [Belnapia sp. T18]|uniref:Uncharacterized protein n=1 Tax=Belnapia arida TaxID=2804533 RepID=A0ABS1UF95_9PROT|nr:hypothetical protein [Belnapia arida]MBL6081941.1 hypothetical protein [Belnapia arida]
MFDMPLARLWLDIPANLGLGQDPDLTFRKAVHLALYAAQDLSNGPITATTHPPRRLAERLRRGLPLSDEEIYLLGEGRWPPPNEAFSLDSLPRSVPPTPVKEGTAAWTLGCDRLTVRKTVPVNGNVYIADLEIIAGPHPRLRQKVGQVGNRGYVAGVPKGLKLLSAMCGLYDGTIRMLPRPITVSTAGEAEAFVRAATDENRIQPLVAVAMTRGEAVEEWQADVEAYAKEAFTLQHVASVSVSGVRALYDLLGPHALPEGAIKTYNAGFSTLDVQAAHPVTTWETIQAHERGRTGMMERWRKRLMTRDAWARRGERT